MKTTYRVDTWLSSVNKWTWHIYENDLLVIHCPPRIEGFPTEAEARAQGEAVVAALTGPARKPVKWHPYTDPPPFDRHVVSVSNDGRVRVTIRQRLSDKTNIAWCFLDDVIDFDALAADARDAMEDAP